MPLATTYNPLLPAPYDIIWSFVVTVIIAIFFLKYLLPKLNAILDERASKIEGGLALAEKAQEEADAARAEKEKELADARREAAQLREDANAQAGEIVAEARDQAKVEAARLVESAHRQIDAERRSAVVSLRSEIGGLATDLAGKIVGEALTDDARQSRVIDRFLDELDQADAGELAGVGASADAQRAPASAESDSAESTDREQ